MDKKQETFILWLAESLGIKDPKELDMKIKNMGQDKLKKLAQHFETEIWPKLQNKINMAKQGSKLAYIQSLNGQCPEGYEVEKFMIGGKVCSRCKKKAETIKKNENVMDSVKEEIESKKCGGKAKKKTKKMQEGSNVPYWISNSWDLYSKPLNAYIPESLSTSFKPKTRTFDLDRNVLFDAWFESNNTSDFTKFSDAPVNFIPNTNYNDLLQTTIGGNAKVNKSLNDFNNIQFQYQQKENPYSIESKLKTYTSDKNTSKQTEVKKEVKKEKPKTENKSNLGGGLYEYMINNGFTSEDASYKGRKQLWQKIFGDKPYIGTAEQNNILLNILKQAGNSKQNTDLLYLLNNLRPLDTSKPKINF